MPRDLGDATATVTGTALVGSVLTCTFNNNDPEGAAIAGPAFQWIRNANTVISGATSSTYTPTPADLGSTIKCRVGYTDGAGFVESIDSNATAAIAAGADTGDATATVTGTAASGSLLTCTFNNNDPDGAAFSGPTFQWMRGASNIGGATTSTYTAIPTDIGSALKCRVSYMDGKGNAEVIDSNSTATITAGTDTGNATASLSGTAAVGQNLICTFNNNDPDGAAFSGPTYQWSTSTSGDVPGATSYFWTVTSSYIGQTAFCRVSYTDAKGIAEVIQTANSAAIVGDTGDATASIAWQYGVAQEGQYVTCTFHNNDPEGPSITAPIYTWYRNWNTVYTGSGNTSSYLAQAADVGSNLTCRVSYTDPSGTSELIASPTSAIVADVPVGVYYIQDAVGLSSFYMPNYNVARLEVWGPGCGGSSQFVGGVSTPPSAAGNSSCTTPGLGLVAQGGQPPTASGNNDLPTQAAASVASGGNVSNASGGIGGVGAWSNTGANSVSGDGGASPAGGAGGVGRNHAAVNGNVDGLAGTAPGGGGSGSAGGFTGTARSRGAAGGNGGAYSCSDFYYGLSGYVSIGALWTSTVGAGSAGANVSGIVGGYGANGRVKLTILA